mmetsp:Transcript_8171/g.20977  ORF Transcript_8171/g.20977 Transcript_8171/m.20977 type:complete len:219 (-) Transcript_8171:148-804(-)
MGGRSHPRTASTPHPHRRFRTLRHYHTLPRTPRLLRTPHSRNLRLRRLAGRRCSRQCNCCTSKEPDSRRRKTRTTLLRPRHHRPPPHRSPPHRSPPRHTPRLPTRSFPPRHPIPPTCSLPYAAPGRQTRARIHPHPHRRYSSLAARWSHPRGSGRTGGSGGCRGRACGPSPRHKKARPTPHPTWWPSRSAVHSTSSAPSCAVPAPLRARPQPPPPQRG